MKKNLIILCAICSTLAFSSCRSQKEVINLSDIKGEWNIIEINGAAVAPSPGRDFPNIGFDISTGKISGSSGCNRIMGSFDTKAKAGELNLGNIAGTRLMCPEMTIEVNVLNALKNVKGYKSAGTGKMALINAHDRPVIVLGPREVILPISSLEGEWRISKVKESVISADLETKPFIVFDLKAKRIHGNAGCNMINGGIVIDDKNPYALSFPLVSVTMMACPDMSVERKVLDALDAVRSFDVLPDRSIVLYGEGHAQLMMLKRK